LLFFWTGYAPRFVDLLLLYDATNEPRFLDAAWKAARFFAMHCWFAPRVPEENVTVNQGGVAPVYYYLADRTVGPISIPEESVPAWRVSAQGLTCESSGTSTGPDRTFQTTAASSSSSGGGGGGGGGPCLISAAGNEAEWGAADGWLLAGLLAACLTALYGRTFRQVALKKLARTRGAHPAR